jgi:molybdate transport system ATP-binding protein
MSNLAASIQKRRAGGFALDVDFSVPPGITMLFGASGSGKTTVLRSIAGLLRPDHGHVSVAGLTLFDSSDGIDLPVQQRNVGYVFQQLALFPHLTVEQNLLYGLTHVDHALRRERARAIAESFMIAHLLERKPDGISGGERQRTALARSLVTNPAVLLLDEPLSALDHATQSRIIDDLRAWNAARAIPILYVTHAHREVFALGERVIALQGGRILAQGTPHDVLDTPAQEPLAQLAGFENLFHASVETVRAEAGTMHCRLEGGPTELEVPLSTARPGSSIRIAIRAGDIMVAVEEPHGLSARNVLPGVVRSLRREGATVVAHVAAGPLFEIHLTPGALESLRLVAGGRVWVVIKTYSCRPVSV